MQLKDHDLPLPTPETLPFSNWYQHHSGTAVLPEPTHTLMHSPATPLHILLHPAPPKSNPSHAHTGTSHIGLLAPPRAIKAQAPSVLVSMLASSHPLGPLHSALQGSFPSLSTALWWLCGV